MLGALPVEQTRTIPAIQILKDGRLQHDHWQLRAISASTKHPLLKAQWVQTVGGNGDPPSALENLLQ
jgi:hypothetical protein